MLGGGGGGGGGGGKGERNIFIICSLNSVYIFYWWSLCLFLHGTISPQKAEKSNGGNQRDHRTLTDSCPSHDGFRRLPGWHVQAPQPVARLQPVCSNQRQRGGFPRHVTGLERHFLCQRRDVQQLLPEFVRGIPTWNSPEIDSGCFVAEVKWLLGRYLVLTLKHLQGEVFFLNFRAVLLLSTTTTKIASPTTAIVGYAISLWTLSDNWVFLLVFSGRKFYFVLFSTDNWNYIRLLFYSRSQCQHRLYQNHSNQDKNLFFLPEVDATNLCAHIWMQCWSHSFSTQMFHTFCGGWRQWWQGSDFGRHMQRYGGITGVTNHGRTGRKGAKK